MRLPSLAAILDSEKAKPLASSHPGKISSVPQELLKNAKKWLLPNIARFHACATGLIGMAHIVAIGSVPLSLYLLTWPNNIKDQLLLTISNNLCL